MRGSIEIRFEAVASTSREWIKRVVGSTLRAQGTSKGALSVLLTDNRTIQRINKKHLSHDCATDVISFWVDKKALTGPEKRYLGDIVVSVQMARQKAKELGIPFKEELARYLVHGVLHLLGYKDKTKKDYLKMHERQEQILETIGHQVR